MVIISGVPIFRIFTVDPGEAAHDQTLCGISSGSVLFAYNLFMGFQVRMG